MPRSALHVKADEESLQPTYTRPGPGALEFNEGVTAQAAWHTEVFKLLAISIEQAHVKPALNSRSRPA